MAGGGGCLRKVGDALLLDEEEDHPRRERLADEVHEQEREREQPHRRLREDVLAEALDHPHLGAARLLGLRHRLRHLDRRRVVGLRHLGRLAADVFRRVANDGVHEAGDGEADEAGREDAPPPAEGARGGAGEQRREERAEVVRDVPEPPVRAALLGGEPRRDNLRARRAAPALQDAVEAPQHAEPRQRRAEAEHDVDDRLEVAEVVRAGGVWRWWRCGWRRGARRGAARRGAPSARGRRRASRAPKARRRRRRRRTSSSRRRAGRSR